MRLESVPNLAVQTSGGLDHATIFRARYPHSFRGCTIQRVHRSNDEPTNRPIRPPYDMRPVDPRRPIIRQLSFEACRSLTAWRSGNALTPSNRVATLTKCRDVGPPTTVLLSSYGDRSPAFMRVPRDRMRLAQTVSAQPVLFLSFPQRLAPGSGPLLPPPMFSWNRQVLLWSQLAKTPGAPPSRPKTPRTEQSQFSTGRPAPPVRKTCGTKRSQFLRNPKCRQPLPPHNRAGSPAPPGTHAGPTPVAPPPLPVAIPAQEARPPLSG